MNENFETRLRRVETLSKGHRGTFFEFCEMKSFNLDFFLFELNFDSLIVVATLSKYTPHF